MRLIRAAVCTGGIIVSGVAASPVAAQTLVSGTIRDSLSARPFAGARIELVPAATPWLAGFTARSDSAGRYRIADVPAGRYLVGFQHARLDSLGLDAVSGALDVSGSPARVTADLSLPSARTFVRALCGAGGGDTLGVLVGRVVDASSGRPVTRGTVLVHWGEIVVGSDGTRSSRVPRTVTVSRDGRYVACNVPTDVPVLVQARVPASAAAPTDAQTSTSGEIELAFAYDMPFLHRDILVGASGRDDATVTGAPTSAPTRRGSARLTARVLRDDGSPVLGARVRVPVADIQAVTDATGVAQLHDLPAGSHSVEVTALGHAPLRGSADLRPDADATTTLRASRTVPTLDAVTVRSARERDVSGFHARRAKGLGYFVDSEQIRKWGPPSLGSALAMAPMLRQEGAKQFGRGRCTPVYFVDGVRVDYKLDEVFNAIDIGGVEVYANPADAPPQFGSPGNARNPDPFSGGCTVIVIWTLAFVR